MSPAIVLRIEKEPLFRCLYLTGGGDWSEHRLLARTFPDLNTARVAADQSPGAHAIHAFTPAAPPVRPAFCPLSFVAATAGD